MEIVLATHNLDKCKELQKSFNNTNINVYTLQDFPHIADIIEHGDTLEENPFIKDKKAKRTREMKKKEEATLEVTKTDSLQEAADKLNVAGLNSCLRDRVTHNPNSSCSILRWRRHVMSIGGHTITNEFAIY